ncbi:MAG TPA: HNH endonuclease [Dehalococcoidia bacterium]|nr:HNH endonuclease [Dehalococcoidia bacterium]
MINPGDIISYIEMCNEEKVNLQRGMNYHLRGETSVILMSLRANAPYSDRVEEEGHVLIYEGHDVPKKTNTPIPKVVDQPMRNPGGTLSQNGLFYEAARRYRSGGKAADFVKVYEKIHRGIWVYNGVFKLTDAWQEESNNRKVFKFKLELVENIQPSSESKQQPVEIEHSRIIPPRVKLAVWKRDKGRCVVCGSNDNLHFDHIIPFSKGGSSLVAENIQLLCARHNIAKRDKIE